ncbi:hypothetical protein [Methylomonas sp. AM2-LC]|uniref:hypothetical protein n=1 Tax=Methylomonas sp. AM2-LC TaxID=3153301 RepID=UPI0032666B1D
MKNIKILASLVLALSSVSGQTFAHNITGGLGIAPYNGNNGASDTDLYQISCFTDTTEPSQQPTHKLYVNIINNSATAGALSAQAFQINSVQPYSVNTTDLIGGDLTGSPDTYLVNPPSVGDGDKTYYIAVNHTNKVASNYLLTFHCLDASGVHTGTDIQSIQNQ